MTIFMILAAWMLMALVTALVVGRTLHYLSAADVLSQEAEA